MPKARFEILFFGILFSLSFTFLIVKGDFSPYQVKINPNEMRIDSVTDLNTKMTENIDYIFKNGYLFSYKAGREYSDYYNGSITRIKTSDYWQFPMNDKNSNLFILERNHKKILSLEIQELSELPVVSLVFDPNDFFSFDKGIYVSGYAREMIKSPKLFPMPWVKPANYYLNRDDERKVFFSYFDSKGKHQYSTYAYAEISGKATRSFPQKSIRLKTDKRIGDKKFKFFPFGGEEFYENLVFRNGGNDNTKSLIRDWLMQSLLSPSGVLTSNFQPCKMYLNGEFWGIFFIQNRLDSDFIHTIYNCKKKDITIMENWLTDTGDELMVEELVNHIKNENFDYDYLEQEIDMENLAVYLSGEFFFANTDWPFNNLKAYRFRSGKSNSKWKFAFFDLDYGMGYTGKSAVNMDMFQYIGSRQDLFSKLIQFLLKQAKFKDIFKEKLTELNTKWCRKQTVLNLANKLEKILEPEIEEHLLRWRPNDNLNSWKKELFELKEFATNRNEVINKQIEKYLK